MDGGRSDALERERQLVARAKAGSRRALDALLGTYGPALYQNVLLPRVGSEAAAKEALGETYSRVVARIGTFSWSAAGFQPWLRTVALQVAIDQLASRKRVLFWGAGDVQRELDVSSKATPVAPSLSSQRDREAARAKIETALAQIHPRYARAIRLRILDARPRDQAASALEVTPAAFDVLLHRAVGALERVTRAHGGDGSGDGGT